MNIKNEVDRIVNFIKNVIQESNTTGVIVGLSGGIDSTLTAGLCTRALGKDNVFAFIMPCHSNKADLTDAKLVIDYLDIK